MEKTEKRLEIIDFHGERGHFRQFFQTSLEKCGATSTKNTIWKNGGENWKNTKILQKFRICNIAVSRVGLPATDELDGFAIDSSTENAQIVVFHRAVGNFILMILHLLFSKNDGASGWENGREW